MYNTFFTNNYYLEAAMTNSFNNDIKFLSLFKHGTKVNFLPPEFKKDYLPLIFISSNVSKQSAINDGHNITIFLIPLLAKLTNSISV